jgi:hypothetical protein
MALLSHHLLLLRPGPSLFLVRPRNGLPGDERITRVLRRRFLHLLEYVLSRAVEVALNEGLTLAICCLCFFLALKLLSFGFCA